MLGRVFKIVDRINFREIISNIIFHNSAVNLTKTCSSLGQSFFIFSFIFEKLLSSFSWFYCQIFKHQALGLEVTCPCVKLSIKKSLLIKALWNKEWRGQPWWGKAGPVRNCRAYTHTRKQHRQWTFQGQDAKCNHQSVSCTEMLCTERRRKQFIDQERPGQNYPFWEESFLLKQWRLSRELFEEADV